MNKVNQLIIEQAGINDIPGLASLAIETFYDTYQAFNSSEDMEIYVNKHFTADQLARELSMPDVFYFIAREENEMLGYFKLRNGAHPASIQHLRPLELERIYVHPAKKGCGIGTALLSKAESFAGSNNYQAIWLGVWNQNEKAIRFYTNYGFTQFGKQSFLLGNDVQEDLCFVLKLN